MAKKSFEESLARLEEIVRSLESGSAPLDESMKLYEEGIALVRACGKELDAAEAKIKILQNSPDGGVVAMPFEPEKSEN